MTGFLREWILTLAAAALGSAVAVALTPEGKVKSVLRFAVSIAMFIALVSPLAGLDMESYAREMAAYRETMLRAEKNGAETADRLNRTIIERETAAYISDKGTELGLGAFPVRVLAKWGDEFWYPYEVWLETAENEKLIRHIEGSLGVPRERIHWSNEDSEAE